MRERNFDGEVIDNIYYSETIPYKLQMEVYYVSLRNNSFLMITQNGAESIPFQDLPKDLKPINPSGPSLNSSDYKGIKIIGSNVPGKSGRYFLLLENNLKMGVRTMWFDQSLYFNDLRWKPNEEFRQQKLVDFQE